ncbi:hypothetical protein ABK040_009456 [Willaertia magna]
MLKTQFALRKLMISTCTKKQSFSKQLINYSCCHFDKNNNNTHINSNTSSVNTSSLKETTTLSDNNTVINTELKSCCHKTTTNPSLQQPIAQTFNINDTTNPSNNINNNKQSVGLLDFWKCKHTWQRASFNTLNCLIGCSIGDFGMLWFLTTNFPSLPILTTVMPICMLSGITTSLALETFLLKTREKFKTWRESFKTAMKMSFVSMLTMELAENITDYTLMKYYFGAMMGNNNSVVVGEMATTTMTMFQVNEPAFWISLSASLFMGYIVPLPYNYYQLKKYGKSCH